MNYIIYLHREKNEIAQQINQLIYYVTNPKSSKSPFEKQIQGCLKSGYAQALTQSALCNFPKVGRWTGCCGRDSLF